MTGRRIRQEYEAEVPVGQLHEHPANPRRGDMEALDESMAEHGFYGAVYAQRSTGAIVAGNHRHRTAVERGEATVPVIWLHVDDDRAKRILLVDNRTSDKAEADPDAELLLLLELAETPGGLAGTGYDDEALQALLDARALGDPEPGRTDEDAVPDPPAPRTTTGDVWRLGPHRVICGKAEDQAVVDQVVAGDTIDLLLTDPPYGVDYEGKTARRLTIENDDLAGDAFYQMLAGSFAAAARHLRKGGPGYVFYSGAHGAIFRRAFVDAGLLLKQDLIWVKQTFVLGRQDYQWQHEPVLYGWKPGAAHRWYGGHAESTVLDDETALEGLTKAELLELVRGFRANTTVLREDRPTRSLEHPTMKPVRLLARILENSTRRGGIVLDPYGGSGSTLIAAHRTVRTARLVEKDPAYVDVICRRWQEHTGVVPVLEETGAEHDFTAGEAAA